MKQSSPNSENNSENVFAACIVMALFILAIIHFTQTGGLPAFFARF